MSADPFLRGRALSEIDKLYEAVLGLKAPWSIERVETQLQAGEVHVWVALPTNTLWVCPECGAAAPIHDHQERSWRHLDTCQFHTIVHARVPRLKCPTHGIRQLKVPWAEPGSQFTAMFEALAIDWLQQASVSAVSKHLRISWDEAAGIQSRAVQRGLARRAQVAPKYVGVDETSFQKRHEYVTVVSDLERGQVLHVANDRTIASLDEFWASLPHAHLVAIEAVAMDMYAPYIQSTLLNVPAADEKIVFDRFHIAQLLNQALDQVRRMENRELRADGDTSLVGTRFDWLRHPANFTRAAARAFEVLRARVHRMARAWELKETAMAIFDLKAAWAARRNFEVWFQSAIRSRIEPIKRVARTLRRYWDQIENYFRHRITNAGAEAINTKIQQVKRRSRGFRSRERFREAIYFHCGGLDLYPSSVASRP
jgi:transposase